MCLYLSEVHVYSHPSPQMETESFQQRFELSRMLPQRRKYLPPLQTKVVLLFLLYLGMPFQIVLLGIPKILQIQLQGLDNKRISDPNPISSLL